MLTVEGLLKKIVDRIFDPVILRGRISRNFSEHAEAEKRGRCIAVSGLATTTDVLPASERWTDLKTEVLKILNILLVVCELAKLYRISMPDASRPRLVKVVLPSQYYWRRALVKFSPRCRLRGRFRAKKHDYGERKAEL